MICSLRSWSTRNFGRLMTRQTLFAHVTHADVAARDSDAWQPVRVLGPTPRLADLHSEPLPRHLRGTRQWPRTRLPDSGRDIVVELFLVSGPAENSRLPITFPCRATAFIEVPTPQGSGHAACHQQQRRPQRSSYENIVEQRGRSCNQALGENGKLGLCMNTRPNPIKIFFVSFSRRSYSTHSRTSPIPSIPWMSLCYCFFR